MSDNRILSVHLQQFQHLLKQWIDLIIHFKRLKNCRKSKCQFHLAEGYKNVFYSEIEFLFDLCSRVNSIVAISVVSGDCKKMKKVENLWV